MNSVSKWLKVVGLKFKFWKVKRAKPLLELEFTNPANVQKVIYMENNKKKKAS